MSPFDVTHAPPAMPLSDAHMAAALLAIEPRLGGILVRSWSGAGRDAFCAQLARLFAPVRRVPVNVGQDRLLGGIDLPATLAAGRPVRQAGLLEEAAGGALILHMAERLTAFTAAQVCRVADDGGCVLIALDEGDDEEAAPAGLSDRLAFTIGTFPEGVAANPAVVAAARRRLVESGDAAAQIAQLGAALGVPGLRPLIFALHAARAAAALRGAAVVEDEDIALAARLVLSPRATRDPAAQAEPAAPEPQDVPEQSDGADQAADSVQDAESAALPADLLAALLATAGPKRAKGAGGGGATPSLMRGRPIGARRGALTGHARLALLDTLRAAAPWQRVRPQTGRICVRAEDFRIRRFREKTRRVAIFAVDASGSSAVNRLAEAKGAIIRLLGDCYVARDEVALIAFRGAAAELLLPPTGALARVRRALAALPGGGPTPLAGGIDAAAALAAAQTRRGRLPYLVLLTDGGANIGRDGKAGRAAAGRDALAAARACAAARLPVLVVDTAPRANAFVAQIARASDGRYLALPYANAARLSAAAQDLGASLGRR